MGHDKANPQTTPMKEFGRSVRNEKHYNIYDHRYYFKSSMIPPGEILSWLRKRYMESRRGNRYRVVTYAHKNGNRYIDYIYVEKINDTDLVYMKMRWGTFGEDKVLRGERIARRKLTKDQRAARDALVQRVLEDFYNNL